MSKEEDFLAKARKLFEQDCADEKPLRDEAEKDLLFVAGEQWEPAMKAARIKAGRPAMTFNRSHTFVQQVSNEARQNKTAIKYTPAEDGDKDTAEIYEGLARHIHYSSKGQIARETAIEYSAGGSFGYIGYLTDYCNDENDDQDLVVRPFYDPFCVYGVLIPALYGLPRKHAFVVEEIPKDEYIATYGDTYLAKNWDASAKSYSGWIGTETVKIAEYWYVEEEEAQTKSGRKITKKRVKFCKINGCEILPDSETDWVGSTIPIYAVLGKQMFVNGKPKLFSVVRFQRDPQQLINYYKTRIAETLGTAPIAPYIMPVGSIPADRRGQWMNAANSPNVLEYNVVSDVDGKPVPPPQRQVFEPPIMALSNAALQEIDDMKATTGIFDASLGQKSNESSGIALARRQQQADITNMHFLDNLTRADQEAGKDMAEILPKIYDTPRMIRILGADETPKIVKVNQQFQEKSNDPQSIKQYTIGGDGVGKYDIIVTTERSFSTKRMESFDMMAQVIQANPDILPMVGDIFFANSDMAGAQQLAERFKKMLPQNLQDEKEGEQPIPPQVQEAMKQMQQQLQVATQVGQEMHREIEQYKAGAQVKQMEIEHKERLEAMKYDFEKLKLQTQTQVEAEKLHSAESTAIFKGEVDLQKNAQNLDAQAAAAEASQAAEQI